MTYPKEGRKVIVRDREVERKEEGKISHSQKGSM